MNFINLTCERCGGSMTIDENCRICKCPYCGAQFLADESDGVKVFRIQQESKRNINLDNLKYQNIEDKRAKRHEILNKLISDGTFFILILIVLLFLHVTWSNFKMHKSLATYAYAPVGSKELIGENYEEAFNRFKDSGFENIETEEIEDLKDSWFSNASSKVNTVAKATIRGKDSFRKGDSFKKDDPVRIYYHVYPKQEENNSSNK